MSIDLAMIMTVRNEERFLAANLAWHYHMGVRRAYIYLDRCSDRSEAIAKSFPWVESRKRDRPASCRYLAAYLEECAGEALLAARRDGVKWLLYLDADEFACGDEGTGAPVSDDLALLVGRATPRTDMIVLRPREAIPVRTGLAEPFDEHVYFQDGPIVERDLLDPSSRIIRRLDKLIGHNVGKSIVRVDADVEPRGAHRWRAVGGAKLRCEFRGFHYHFVVTGPMHFREKYGKFCDDPDTFQSGAAVPFPKQAFKLVAMNMPPEEIDRYYHDWVAMGIDDLERLVGLGIVVKDLRLKLALGRLAVRA